MDLSIIIVNWKSKDYLRKCLQSVYQYTTGIDYEVIVIDSASYDGCGEMLAAEFPEVHFIQSDKNLGFAKANNVAFEASIGEFVLFLNPDTELNNPAINVLYGQIRALQNPGTVGCKLLNGDGSVQTSCLQSIPTILNQLLDSEFLRAKWPTSSLWGMAPLFESDGNPARVEAISGACVMMQRSIFEQVGRFSEDYFMYAEDIDLSYKSLRSGRINYYIPAASIIHYGGSSSNQAPSNFSVIMMREAIWRFLRKFEGNLYASGYRIIMLASALLRLGAIVSKRIFVASHDQASAGSAEKWRAILRWSLNLEHGISKYYPSR
jgi:GT2 family glycosyltransferase